MSAPALTCVILNSKGKQTGFLFLIGSKCEKERMQDEQLLLPLLQHRLYALFYLA